MQIRITDEMADVTELNIRHFDNIIEIELPRNKSADDIVRTIKVVASQLIKAHYEVEKSYVDNE